MLTSVSRSTRTRRRPLSARSGAELLPQAHFHARGRLRHGGILRERTEFNPSRLPGVLQRRTSGTPASVFPRGRTLRFAQRGVALRVQSHRSKFFAVHLVHPVFIVTAVQPAFCRPQYGRQISKLFSSRHTRTPRHIAKHFQFGHQQSPAAM